MWLRPLSPPLRFSLADNQTSHEKEKTERMTYRDRCADMKKTNLHEKGAEIKEIQDTFLYPCLFGSKKTQKYFPLIFTFFLW